MSGRIGVDAVAGELGCSHGQHSGSGSSDIFDHHVVVELLGRVRVRPARRLVTGRQLERQPGCLGAGGYHDPFVTLVSDLAAELLGIEGGEAQRVRAVDHGMVQLADHRVILLLGKALVRNYSANP